MNRVRVYQKHYMHIGKTKLKRVVERNHVGQGKSKYKLKLQHLKTQ